MNSNSCYHCGADCGIDIITLDDKYFCCNGCKTVYEILNVNELNCYYNFEESPGTIPNEVKGKFNYLENEAIVSKLLDFNDGDTAIVEFSVPNIHCSSCIWVLENLQKLNKGVLTSIVNFPKKLVHITFKNNITSLKELAELLTLIGYEPYISLENFDSQKNETDKKLLYQLFIAAFAFGNIMLLSFPEYFESDEFWLNTYKPLFRWLMFAMALPVVFYSAKDYFITSYKGFKNKILNIDIPISLGITVLFIRSSFDIIFNISAGFFDSLTGLIFFLLLGKLFQQKTYSYLSFERDYKSYFPIGVTKIEGKREINVAIKDILKGDRLLIRNNELIPVDGILITENTAIDYSFVTGESNPVQKKSGDILFAGGRQTSGAVEMEVVNSIEQSYLTQLWGNDAFKKENKITIKNITDSISKYFTLAILLIASFAGFYWYFKDISIAINVVTAVLIIACPCALALSAPFALGNMLRIFGYRKFYLKNAEVIEKLSKISIVIFDKTGTITTNEKLEISYKGANLSTEDYRLLKTSLRASNHPLSRALYNYINQPIIEDKAIKFQEFIGRGIRTSIKDNFIEIGSADFLNINSTSYETEIFVKINGVLKGNFIFKNSYRTGLTNVFNKLSKKYNLIILSGDNEGEKKYLESIMPNTALLKFNQKPEDKLQFVKSLQQKGEKVLMIGDGLNDSGALAQSDIGIAISENVNLFSPACDAILEAKRFNKLPDFLSLSLNTMSIIKLSFVISFLYNLIGMYYAISGTLTPIIAAILMPLSSITIVVFVTILTNFVAKKYSLEN